MRSSQGVVEVLPGVLRWAPGLTGVDTDAPPASSVEALSLCLDGGSDAPLYQVVHYSPRAVGLAFGPLSLACTLRFCRNLALKLDGAAGPLTLTTPAGDDNARANAAVLVGAYLILYCDMPHREVARLLGAEAQRGFLCSWAKKLVPENERNLKVDHCWRSFETVHSRGWVPSSCLSCDDATNMTCEGLLKLATCYDACWVVPGHIMVAADPVTTAMDPNPSTFSMLFPPSPSASEKDPRDKAGEEGASVSTRAGSEPSLTGTDTMSSPRSPMSGPRRRVDSGSYHSTSKLSHTTSAGTVGVVKDPSKVTICSVDTVSKDYVLSSHSEEEDDEILDFTSFLREAGVQHLVRTNFDKEPGMPEAGSYQAKDFITQGFSHVDIRIVDRNGGLPRRQDVVKLLRTAPSLDLASDGAVAVHCKGGFGRSVVVACLLAIDRFDVPGDVLLAWVRIARPGSINTPQQEQFLQAFRGRADLRKWAGLGLGDQPTCGCSVQ